MNLAFTTRSKYFAMSLSALITFDDNWVCT
jgi:hypothetical protein